jgi:uncharacterized protein DUF3108
MRKSRRLGWGAALAILAAVLAACAGVVSQTAPGPAVTAPSPKVGDRWVYRGQEGYRTKILWEETHEITAISADGITVRVTLRGSGVDIARIETWSAPGVVRVGAVYETETDRFDPPLIRYKYPLAPGASWNQSLRDLDKERGPYGPIRRHVTVSGYETVSTPAGTFDAIRMRTIMQLDDETFWRYATQCDYVEWYAPAVGAMVKEQKRSYWSDKGGRDAPGGNPGQNSQIELVSFTRGG